MPKQIEVVALGTMVTTKATNLANPAGLITGTIRKISLHITGAVEYEVGYMGETERKTIILSLHEFTIRDKGETKTQIGFK